MNKCGQIWLIAWNAATSCVNSVISIQPCTKQWTGHFKSLINEKAAKPTRLPCPADWKFHPAILGAVLEYTHDIWIREWNLMKLRRRWNFSWREDVWMFSCPWPIISFCQRLKVWTNLSDCCNCILRNFAKCWTLERKSFTKMVYHFLNVARVVSTCLFTHLSF